ncbi:hypothetical protein PsorP6_005578 [Peronosclerospora sorghi]|uniref:Uncharacterized protein n=1 Tax=Peronosclerospora sorghi TaxID=230839 RepID=A0ACC0W5X3_9STRA|nr:hypothetical protein PsorP6_005578 [Peronosclerospora sorghi]
MRLRRPTSCRAPIQTLKEGVLLDRLHTFHLKHARFPRAQALLDVSLQQLLENGMGVRTKPLGQRKLRQSTALE